MRKFYSVVFQGIFLPCEFVYISRRLRVSLNRRIISSKGSVLTAITCQSSLNHGSERVKTWNH